MGQDLLQELGTTPPDLLALGAGQVGGDDRYQANILGMLQQQPDRQVGGRRDHLRRILDQVDEVVQETLGGVVEFAAQRFGQARDGDARLSDHLRAQILDGVLQGDFQLTHKLDELLVINGTGNDQRPHLL